jgi:hypothetical protein
VPEGVASDLIDRSSVAVVGLIVVVRIRHRASMNSAVLSGSEIYHSVLSHGEVNTESASIDKRHVALLVPFDPAEHVLLIRVGLSFQLH